jgi:hypothetical protein
LVNEKTIVDSRAFVKIEFWWITSAAPARISAAGRPAAQQPAPHRSIAACRCGVPARYSARRAGHALRGGHRATRRLSLGAAGKLSLDIARGPCYSLFTEQRNLRE